MAEGFEVYHVPQQSRRDKLRVGNSNTNNNNNNFQISSNLLPLYDPSSLISSHDFPINNHTTTPFHDHINPSSLYHAASYSGIGIGIGSGGGGVVDDVTLFKHHSEVEPLSLELNLQRYGSFTSSSSINVTNHHHHHDSSSSSSSVVPLGPFTGYASILKGSKFLKPAQVLLQDLFDYGGRLGNNIDDDDDNDDNKLVISDDSSFMDPLLDNLDADFVNSLHHHDPISCSEDGTDHSRRRKSRLISMLDEVYRRYKQYYQQMQAVVTTFEYVAGLGNAAPYVNLAVKSMFKHFRLLKNAIADQLQFNNNKTYNPYCQRSVHNATGYLDHHQPVWRPQRGLPESAVTVLRAWLFEHFLHPYPTDTDKLMLANQTGLSRSQVSNWFINARVRLWKPMVEEIHMLETRQAAQKSQQREGGNGNGNGGNRLNNDHVSSTNSLKPGQNIASASNQDHRNELMQDMAARNEPLNSLSNPSIFSTHPHAAAGASMGGGSVSLTLGLHQNNIGIGLSEPFPINAAQHFNIGLEGNGEGFVMSGFGAENRHFVRNGIGGQMLHDFVG